MPANTLKVDRSTIYGNPFGGEVRTPNEAVAMFENWLADPAWDQHAGAGYPALIVKQLMGSAGGGACIVAELARFQPCMLVPVARRWRNRWMPCGGAAETG